MRPCATPCTRLYGSGTLFSGQRWLLPALSGWRVLRRSVLARATHASLLFVALTFRLPVFLCPRKKSGDRLPLVEPVVLYLPAVWCSGCSGQCCCFHHVSFILCAGYYDTWLQTISMYARTAQLHFAACPVMPLAAPALQSVSWILVVGAFDSTTACCSYTATGHAGDHTGCVGAPPAPVTRFPAVAVRFCRFCRQ
jgi:hypothetical protein